MTDNARQHILAIDDSPENIKAIHAICQSQYDMHFALTGDQGLALAEQLQPDLILLDVVMPEMDGYRVCQSLKENPATRDIPVIFLTALNSDEDEARGLSLGAVDYLHKPIRKAITLARIQLHLRLKQQQDQLRALAVQDPLTGLYNRRALFEKLETEWYRSVRDQFPLSLIMADIDHFKAYNDTYGHLKGDQCLKAVAEIMHRSARRPADFVGRYGGEEFCCVLAETDLHGARSYADLVMEQLAEQQIKHREGPAVKRVSLSMGIVSFVPCADLTIHQVVSEADRLLYQAKAEGRNRYVSESM